MKIRTRTSIAAVAIASVVGGGAAGAVLSGPATAFAQEAEDEGSALTEDASSLEDVLAELVADGTITQTQADSVATAIEEAGALRGHGHRHHRGGFIGDGEELATILGMTTDELSEALRSGSSIADIAAENSVDVQEIIDLLVAQAQERLDTAVAEGRLTADEAAEKSSELATRITEKVNGEFEGRGRGNGGPGGGGDVDTADAETETDV